MHFPHVHRIAEGAVQLSWPALIDLSIHQLVMEMDQHIQENPFPGWIENVPSYHTLTIYFDPLRAPSEMEEILLAASSGKHSKNCRQIRIPVCYDEHVAPDLKEVSLQLKLSAEKIIQLHTSNTFHVFMIGFLPGFPYMGVLPEELEVPRKATPALSIPEGAVAIAGKQTGIYPVSSPGGWHVIGLTPFPMFKEGTPLLQPGDEIRFYAIEIEEYHRLKKHYSTTWPSI